MPEIKTRIYCTLRFEGYHRWKDAPPHVRFLAHEHRHLFTVRAEVIVPHNDRAVEFLTLKHALEQDIESQAGSRDAAEWSCEQWATWLLETHQLTRVEVSEDGENGAIVEIN